jgi:hypothetical protein
VITTLNVQGQDVLEFLTKFAGISFGSPMPSLLPKARPLKSLPKKMADMPQLIAEADLAIARQGREYKLGISAIRIAEVSF